MDITIMMTLFFTVAPALVVVYLYLMARKSKQ